MNQLSDLLPHVCESAHGAARDCPPDSMHLNVRIPPYPCPPDGYTPDAFTTLIKPVSWRFGELFLATWPDFSSPQVLP